MSVARFVPVLLLGAGAFAIGDAVVRGGATVMIVVFVPVLLGRSAEFLVGVVLLLAGFFALPWLGSRAVEPTDASPLEEAMGSPPAASGTGGVVLIGPLPIFFGSWGSASRRTRWWVAVAGAAATALLLVLLAFALGA